MSRPLLNFGFATNAEGGAASPSMQAIQEIERGRAHRDADRSSTIRGVCEETEPGNIKLRQFGAGERTCASARVITFVPCRGLQASNQAQTIRARSKKPKPHTSS